MLLQYVFLNNKLVQIQRFQHCCVWGDDELGRGLGQWNDVSDTA